MEKVTKSDTLYMPFPFRSFSKESWDTLDHSSTSCFVRLGPCGKKNIKKSSRFFAKESRVHLSCHRKDSADLEYQVACRSYTINVDGHGHRKHQKEHLFPMGLRTLQTRVQRLQGQLLRHSLNREFSDDASNFDPFKLSDFLQM